MKRIPLASRARLMALLFLSTLGACDPTENPLAPEAEPVVVLGQVANIVQPPQAGMSGIAAVRPLSGIEVSIDGENATDLTDDSGNFRLEVRAHGDRVRLRFRRGSLDVRLELSGIPAGGLIHLEVGLDDTGVMLLSSSDSRDDEFEGLATLISIEGDAPGRTVVVELTDPSGSDAVHISEGSTVFDSEGDVVTFAGLVELLDRADAVVKIEGEGERQDDGSVIAAGIKVETDADDDADDDDDADEDADDDDDADEDENDDQNEFEGSATMVSVTGDEPARTLRVELVNLGGSAVVDVIEGVTLFDNEGDVLSFGDLLAALDRADLVVEIEGDGEVQDGGAFVASSIKVETDEDELDDADADENDRAEFEGVAALVSINGDAPARSLRVELTDTTRSYIVDIIEGSTLFDNEGDILSFGDLLAALDRADLAVEIEGEGEPQDGGSLVATTVKAEVDDGS